jgi:hypothetical protein
MSGAERGTAARSSSLGDLNTSLAAVSGAAFESGAISRSTRCDSTALS